MPERPRSERVTQDRLAAHITTPEDNGFGFARGEVEPQAAGGSFL